MELQARHVVDLAALVPGHISEVVEDHEAVLAGDADAPEHALTEGTEVGAGEDGRVVNHLRGTPVLP